MKTATCACGHVGKSNRPEHYQCGACYYDARADKLAAEAATFRERSRAFADKHPGAGRFST